MNQPRLIARVPLSTRLDTVPPGASWYADVGDSYTLHVNGAGTDAEPAVGLSLRARHRGHALAAYRFLQHSQSRAGETLEDAAALLAQIVLSGRGGDPSEALPREVWSVLSPREALTLLLLQGVGEVEGVEP